MGTISLTTGQISEPVEVGPGTRVTTSGSGYVEWTSGSLVDVRNGAATWQTWPRSTSTGYCDTLRRVVMRAVATGALTVTWDESEKDEGAEGAYWQEQTAAWSLDASGSVTGLVGPGGAGVAVFGGGGDGYMWTLPASERGIGAVARYGAIPAGAPVTPGAYTAAGLTTALSTASSGSKLVRLDADLVLASDVTIPADVTVYSLIAANVTGAGKLVVSSRSQIIGLRFVGEATTAVAFVSSSAIFAARIACCDFVPSVSNSISISDESTGDNTLHRSCVIERNYFYGHNYAFFGIRAEAMTIQWNECRASTGRNFQFAGGRHSLVRNNRIDGGATGISWLLDAQYGVHAADCRLNVVSDNWIRNITEEGISADIFGNTAARVSVRDQFAVISTQNTYNSNPRVVVPRAATMSPANRSLVFVTGALAGKCVRTTFDATVSAGVSIGIQAANDQFTSAEFSAIQAGDIVTVGHTFCDNVIERNRVSTTGGLDAVCIYLYGNCFRNRVSANIVKAAAASRDGIRVDSLNGLIASNDANRNTTTAVQCAPSSDNVVANNTVVRGGISVRGYSFAVEASSFPAQYQNAVKNNVASVTSGGWTGSGESKVPFSSYTQDANNSTLETNNALTPTTAGGVDLGGLSDAAGRGFAPTPSIGAFELAVSTGLE